MTWTIFDENSTIIFGVASTKFVLGGAESHYYATVIPLKSNDNHLTGALEDAYCAAVGFAAGEQGRVNVFQTQFLEEILR